MKKITICLFLIAFLSMVLFSGCGSADEPTAPEPTPTATAAVDNVEPPAQDIPADEPEPEIVEEAELLIGAAMGLMSVTQQLAPVFESLHPHITLEFTYAASGALQTQIEEGAPIDIFMSAAAAEMRALEAQGLIYGTGRNVVTNVPVLVAPIDSDIEMRCFSDIALEEIGIIGMGDPAITPLGRIAMDVFTALGVDGYATDKAVLGSDVRQVLTWVEMGNVDIGLVWMTDAIASGEVRVVAVADSALHAPVVFPVGIVDESPQKEAAQLFIEFLFSDEAREIYEQHGFAMY